jgi:hypothetical protein
MPVGINFSSERAELMLDALANGKPILPGNAGWSVNDMLALAGACHFAAMSHGPVMMDGRKFGDMTGERREAASETFEADLSAAVQFYSQMTMNVKDGQYNDNFEPTLTGVIFADEEGLHFNPFSGVRNAH